MSGLTHPGETPAESEARLVRDFRRRFAYILQSFRSARAHTEDVLSFNESHAAMMRSLNPRRRVKPSRRRLDPEIELLVNAKALRITRLQEASAEKFDGTHVRAAVREIVEEFKPRRGRAPDRELKLTVHALMALHHQTCGSHLCANTTRNGEYDPHIISPIGQVFLDELRKIDPDVTLVQFVNIVTAARASGEIEGKWVEDLLPSIEWRMDPSTSQPVPKRGDLRIEFVPIAPIYSS